MQIDLLQWIKVGELFKQHKTTKILFVNLKNNKLFKKLNVQLLGCTVIKFDDHVLEYYFKGIPWFDWHNSARGFPFIVKRVGLRCRVIPLNMDYQQLANGKISAEAFIDKVNCA